MVQPRTELIERIRDASRKLVRELGFMEDTLAGTTMSASAVHALIEVASGRVENARELSTALRLEKSTVSRLLRSMIDSGHIIETPAEGDRRLKHLTLTDKGFATFSKLSKTATDQVANALRTMETDDVKDLICGLESYTRALRENQYETAEKHATVDVHIQNGYWPGIIGRTVEMHAKYYSRTVGFGRTFERKVACEMAEFCSRLETRGNATWAALIDGRIVGSVSIDGEDLDGSVAHLRWFIVDDGHRGVGIGKKLMAAAMEFVDSMGFEETHLWTFSGLDAARRLYESEGFLVVEEKPGKQWGEIVNEQKFIRKRH